MFCEISHIWQTQTATPIPPRIGISHSLCSKSITIPVRCNTQEVKMVCDGDITEINISFILAKTKLIILQSNIQLSKIFLIIYYILEIKSKNYFYFPVAPS